ncbi:MAG: hypothetical protein ABJA32_01190, partial [Ginsengibacter sp.]
GNLFDFLPQFERLDASFGDVLLNDGKGKFKWVEQKKSGLNVQGQVRDIVEISNKNSRYILFLLNNDYPVLYNLNNSLFPVRKTPISTSKTILNKQAPR